ncbi:Variable major outer membrane lipoprotein (plasmid) [Borrelia nietonii YOR]|uniref:Variable large protein n=2 Tax=Borrelia TaxID=138 RepID=W5SGC2_9SPIR|nr:variable large family protein [Borrelia nietonii]AHH04186.1 Variable major outer membrane lipoprotein [Borrelia nietonii YOR]UPA10014.1 variable large family protein [Borrelia nietonii YOR]
MRKRISAIINKLNISIMMMIVVLMIGCGQQAVEAGKDGAAAATGGRSLSEVLMDVGRSAENAFYSFLELVSDTLGFTAKSTTKKSDVGDYFTALGKKLGEASAELEEVAKKSEIEESKDSLLNKAIRAAVDTAKTTLNTLKGHLESLEGIGDGKVVGEATSNQQGVAAADAELKNAYNSLKGIVETAKTQQVEEPKKSEVTLSQQSIGVANPEHGAKILATDAAPAVGDAGKATTIVSAVSGEEILASIVISKENDAALGAVDADANTSALKFAKGGNANNLAKAAAKASAVAGGIALRSLVKDGKLAAHNTNNDDKAAQSAGIAAVNKLLVAVEDIIKKTVKNVLDKVKQEVDKARAPKAASQK